MSTTTFTVFHYNRYSAIWEQSLYLGFECITDSQPKAWAKLDKTCVNTAGWIHLGSGPDRLENVFDIRTLLEPSWQEVIINCLLPRLPGPGHWQPSHITPQPGQPWSQVFPTWNLIINSNFFGSLCPPWLSYCVFTTLGIQGHLWFPWGTNIRSYGSK